MELRHIHDAILLSLGLLAHAGCTDDASKNAIQPARTFAAPAKSVDKAHQMSRPIGCNGNPYYFDHETKQWFYYTIEGRAILSPNQPPCFGADVVLNKKSKSPNETPRQ